MTEPIYALSALSFAYPGAAAPVLREISLDIGSGELLSLLGRNGAGKSTLFACMLGLLKPQQGSVTLCGQPLERRSPRERAALVGYVPQSQSQAFDYTVFDYVLMGCAARLGLFSHPGPAERALAEEAIAALGLEALAGRRYSRLSGGERQQAAIARAIAGRPRILLFDEPTAHLDFANQLRVLRIIKDLSRQGYAVAVSSHDPNHALLLGGRAAILDGGGRLRAGTVESLVTEAELRAVYGEALALRYLEEFHRQVCVYPPLE